MAQLRSPLFQSKKSEWTELYKGLVLRHFLQPGGEIVRVEALDSMFKDSVFIMFPEEISSEAGKKMQKTSIVSEG